MSTTGDVYGIGTSGLLAFQRALSVTSHNISNVNTEGYSRQVVELTNRDPLNVGGRSIGTGVNINSVKRMFDNLINNQLLTYTSNSNLYESYHTLASQVDELLANEAISLDSSLQSFFNSIQMLANDPSSTPAREAVLSEGANLANRFHTIKQQISDINEHVNDEIQGLTTELNELASSLAEMNKQIVSNGGASTDFPPNDLLDQRNLILQKISEIVSVSTVEMEDGSVTVFVGSGQPLVLGNQSFEIRAVNSTTNSAQLDLAYNSGGSLVTITDLIDGGQLGGVLRVRTELVDSVTSDLDHLAAGVAMTFNDQHRKGMDLNGNINNNFFNDPAAGGLVLPATTNTGSAAISVTITDATQLTAHDYQLSYNGAIYTLTDHTDNSTVATFPAAGAFPTTYAVAGHGISFTVNGSNPDPGDSFFIDPDNDAAKNISVALTSLQNIAAASPIRAEKALTNIGTATISQGVVVDSTNANLLNTVEIRFTSISPDEFSIVDITAGATLATNVPYVSGNPISFNGLTVEITGTPQLNDVFTVEANTAGVGDNRNALLLAGLQDNAILGNASGTYQEIYGSMVSDVGIKTRQSEINSTAQTTLLQNTRQRYESVSGVNLDEEAANILKYQQAYQAAAQVIVTANTMFQSLLDAFRR